MRGSALAVRWVTRLVSAPPERVAAAIVPLVLAGEYDGRTGRFFKNGQEIDPWTHADPIVQ